MAVKRTNPAVVVKNVTKSFNIPLESSSGIKQKLVNLLKGRKGYRSFTTLNNINFTVEKGDFFGIVGRNGSGKSTLLKTMAGIYFPNEGEVHVNGTLVPFIELGVGFNPELTGRENVFLNGALLGFSHTEMEAMYDAIVDFAELHDFMEERLKNYSSGMQVRLAFSIAIRADGDILLLDEVLAVGDEAFQQKCFDYFEKLKDDKKTVILVTHDMNSVQRFCNRVMLIDDGETKFIGDPSRAALEYKKLNFPQLVQEAQMNEDEGDTKQIRQANKVRITTLKVLNSRGKSERFIAAGTPVTLRFSYESYENIKDVVFGVGLKNKSNESVYGPNTKESKIAIDLKKGKGTFELFIKENIFSPGAYTIDAGVFNGDHTICYDYTSLKNALTIVGVERHGYAYVEPKWTIR